MPSIYHNVPRDVALALTEFSGDFDAAYALGAIDLWAAELGLVRTSDALRTTFPIPLSTAGYRLRDGDDKMRRLYERSLSLTTRDWVDGVYEKAEIVEAAGEWIGWNNEPANMAQEALRHPNVLVSDVLASNPLLDFYRVEHPGGSVASTINLFSAGHPYNVLRVADGTFDNDWAAGDTVQGDVVPGELNATLVKQARKHFRSLVGPNGRPLGLRFAGFLVPAAQEEAALDAFSRDAVLELVKNVAATENVGGVTLPNRFTGTRVIVGDELTGELPSGAIGDPDTVYAFATRSGAAAPPAWVVQTREAPEEIQYTKEDQLYKDASLIGIKFVLRMAAAAALPHAIVRIDLSP